MTLEEIKEKFDLVWKQIQEFIPIHSKEKSERLKRKGIRFEQDSAKKLKTSLEVPKEKLKEIIELIPVEEVYVEALQVKHPITDWEVHTEGERNYWKITRLEGSTASYQFFVDLLKHFDREDLTQLWALVKESLSIRPATSDKELELWVELKRLNKMHKAFPLSVKSSHCQNKFPLLVRKVPPTEDKRCHCQEDRTAIKDREFRKDSYCRIMYRTPCPIKGVLSGPLQPRSIRKVCVVSSYGTSDVFENSESFEGGGVLDEINDYLKFLFLIWHKGFQSVIDVLEVSRNMLLIPSFSIKKLNLSLANGLVKMSAS
nr:hypothetical protein [Tanacetum cinerariifolium]